MVSHADFFSNHSNRTENPTFIICSLKLRSGKFALEKNRLKTYRETSCMQIKYHPLLIVYK